MENALHRFVRLLRLRQVRISIPEALDAMACAREPGMLSDKAHLKAALRVALIKDRRDEEVFDDVFDNRVHNLVSEDVDVALRIISTPPDSVIATEIGAVDWVICASPAYLANHPAPQALADLQGQAIVCASPVGQKLKVAGTPTYSRISEVICITSMMRWVVSPRLR